MIDLIVELIIIICLLAANGLFAMAELAIVSARKTKLKKWAEQGVPGAGAALELAAAPNQFLPTVQIGITLVGLLAATFGGITVAEEIAAGLKQAPGLSPYAEAIGVGIVVVTLTYLSLIIGELVPKRLALANPERLACRVARPMKMLARLTQPVIRVLGASTDFVLWLLRAKAQQPEAVSEEEVKLLVEEGTQAGVFHEAEPKMVESVLSLDRLPIREIMTPLTKLVFLNKNDSHDAIWHKIVVSGHSNFPVHDGSRERVVGVVAVKSVYANLAAGVGIKLSDLMTPPLIVPQAHTVTQLLDRFRKTGQHIAMVGDDAGKIIGMITLVDVLEAIVGEIPSLEERLKPAASRREDGSWLVDGRFALAQYERLAGKMFPRPPTGKAETLADFVAAHLGPALSERASFTSTGLRFEVIDMDHQRIDKVLVTPEPGAR